MTGRGLRGRRAARVLLLTAVAFDVLVPALLFVWAPNMTRPMFPETSPFPWLVPAIAIGVNAIGLAWMVRIYRVDPESGRSSWRATRRAGIRISRVLP